MGLFEKLFGRYRPPVERGGAFRLLDGYTPAFYSWSGELYESDLVRAAIDARARHASKLKVEISGTAKPALQTKLRLGPNAWQTWSQFLYRTSTILDVKNTCIITPVLGEYGETTGIYPLLYRECSLLEYQGEPWIRFELYNGDHASIELRRIGILTRYQYRNDLFGESNNALDSTMALLTIQDQGIKEGVKSAASYKFMATLTNFSTDADLKKERERFSRENLSAGSGGVLLWPNTYKDVRQIESKPFVADAEQVKLINDNVNRYFGVNAAILENRATGDDWSAFYEGAVEPFAIQLAEVLEKMLFTQREREQGTSVTVTSNRLQYMSNNDKLRVSATMLDRGIMSINDVRDIWNLPPVEGGDVRVIRGEYYDADNKLMEAENEPEQND